MSKALIKAALGCSLLGAVFSSNGAHTQTMMDQMIYSKCSSSMAEDYKQAGKVATAGSVNKMCTCVVKESNKLHSIQGAKNLCVAEIDPGST